MKFYPFPALRPPVELSAQVASQPYDVIDSEEARKIAVGNPRSFLHINKPEIDLPVGTNLYSNAVYAKASENFELFKHNGWLRRDPESSFYMYRQAIEGHSQCGWVGVCHTEEYEQNLIKKHERTLQKKEDDRTRHVATLKANAGPIFLMVRAPAELKKLASDLESTVPEVDFTSPDGVRHTVWPVPESATVKGIFAGIPCCYVADGHHRTASAARCSKDFAAANPAHTGNENYNWFLSVMFAADDLMVLPYNRLVKDLNGLSSVEMLGKIREAGFEVSLADDGVSKERADIRMFVDGSWYKLVKRAADGADPVSALDVSILQNDLLSPILGVEDPRTSDRILFKGGFDCEVILQKMVKEGKAAVAFSLYPTSTEEVMAVADQDKIMPPKSTWFEPKLRSGLFVHVLDDGNHVSDS